MLTDSDLFFIAVFNSSASVEEVAKRLGVSRHSVNSRATRLRADGVELKRFRRPQVSTEQFLKMLRACKGKPQRVAEQLGWPKEAVQGRVREARRAGYLPKGESPAEKFVRVWNAAASREAVASALGVSASYVTLRAKQLRKRGFPLKRLSRYRKRVDHVRFVRVWNASESAVAAAKTLGMEEQSARSRATRLRKRGVLLKYFTGTT